MAAPSYIAKYKIYPSSIRVLTSTDGSKFTIASYASSTQSLTNSSGNITALLLTFLSSDYRDLLKWTINDSVVAVKPTGSGGSSIQAIPLTAAFSSSSAISLSSSSYYLSIENDAGYKETFSLIPRSELENILSYGVLIRGNATVYASSAENKPYIEVEYYSPYWLKTQTPANGATIDKRTDITFSWVINNPTSNPPSNLATSAIASQTFTWKQKGSDTTNAIDCGISTFVTVPANTFSGDEIEWTVGGVMSNNLPIIFQNPIVYDEGDFWRTLIVSAPDAISSARILYPNGTVIDGAKEITFVWKHEISTGTEQSSADIQISKDGVSFSDFASVPGSQNTYAVPENTFEAGDLYWRVRTYNSENVPGNWSEIAQAIVYLAPLAPLISMKKISPMPIVGWTANGQVAFEIQIVDQTEKVKIQELGFGSDKQYQSPEYLPDGVYTAKVRVQNKYSLWSDWSTAGFSVANEATGTIDLSAIAVDGAVHLSWSGSSHSQYYIYRNGILISKTAQDNFTDGFALGHTIYQVRGIDAATDYYAMSNSASVKVTVPCIVIASVDNPVWQKLNLSTSSLRKTDLSASHAVSYQHYIGMALPGAEIGEAVNMSYGLDCAFLASDLSAAQQFENLLGKLVCVKEPGGERYVGVLDSYSKNTIGKMYRRYSANITLVDWEETST